MALIDKYGYYKIENVFYSNSDETPKYIVFDLVHEKFKDSIDKLVISKVIRIDDDIPEGTDLTHLAYELLKKENPNFQDFEYEEGEE